MGNKIVAFTSALILLFTVAVPSLADNNPNTILSDPVFYSVSITLSTFKTVSFSFGTNDYVDYIKIWRCWLQKKVDDQWAFDRSLPAPSYIEYNTIGYDAYMDYSSYIPSDGNTYRIGARIEAAGHFVTRYSNQRTF